ncbi:MarR family winged helix-turn-helix transcriptional regulator [Desulfocurvibacter africanus]|uniref:MarR family winged helix-turn-helix transcriptional regulator n=1 Tax=Desulfocurvibacter africanus TaxID=873 RepID=UPI00041E9054|nr:MarR family transcriptional regulator [Desulfocurvibacter africanus]
MEQTDVLTQALIEFYEKFSSWEQGVVKETGLTLPQMHTLEILGSFGNLRMKELAQKMGITTGALTVLVDRVERQGLVTRKPHETDRRSIRVELTPEGDRHFQEHHALHTQLTHELVSSLAPSEADALLVILQKLNSHL